MDEEPEEAVDAADRTRYWLSNVALAAFLFCASVAGFFVSPGVGFYSMAGASLVVALLLGNT